jgi:hypothetical protein
MRARFILPVVLTLLVQRVLGMPGLPSWSVDVLVPVVWVVALSLLRSERPWPVDALLIGLAWDVLFEPVIGPGGIAWSATAMALNGLATVVADRTPRAWAGFGAVAAVLIVTLHGLVLLPLGFSLSLTLTEMARTALLSGAWCGVVGLVLRLDLPKSWRTYRARRLR